MLTNVTKSIVFKANVTPQLKRQMSSTAKVWVDKNTRVICQGFTGKQVSVDYNSFGGGKKKSIEICLIHCFSSSKGTI